jgi:hypothetical protein
VIIDCLGISRQLRAVDPADEMAFLALECAMPGEPAAAERLERDYEAAAGDRPRARLVSWYMGVRAFLRARLLALHSLDAERRPREVWLGRRTVSGCGVRLRSGLRLSHAEQAQPLERLVAVQPADRCSEQRRHIEHGGVCLRRFPPQPEWGHPCW